MKTTVVLSCFCLCFAFGQPVDVQPSASPSEESHLVSPGADVLFTVRFDEGGKWKIVKTHQMSEKEAEKYEQEIQR